MMKKQQSGIALLEALIAIVILAVGLLGAIGLQARAYSALSEANLRADATMAAEQLFGIMSNDQSHLSEYAMAAGGTVPARLTNWCARTKANIPGTATTITVTVTPSTDASRTAVSVAISWKRNDNGPINSHVINSYIAAAS
jgi:type IV pilus assembly protein PilV